PEKAPELIKNSFRDAGASPRTRVYEQARRPGSPHRSDAESHHDRVMSPSCKNRPRIKKRECSTHSPWEADDEQVLFDRGGTDDGRLCPAATSAPAGRRRAAAARRDGAAASGRRDPRVSRRG